MGVRFSQPLFVQLHPNSEVSSDVVRLALFNRRLSGMILIFGRIIMDFWEDVYRLCWEKLHEGVRHKSSYISHFWQLMIYIIAFSYGSGKRITSTHPFFGQQLQDHGNLMGENANSGKLFINCHHFMHKKLSF